MTNELIHLGHDVSVGEPDDHSVFGCVVLVLVLYNQSATCLIVSLSL